MSDSAIFRNWETARGRPEYPHYPSVHMNGEKPSESPFARMVRLKREAAALAEASLSGEKPQGGLTPT